MFVQALQFRGERAEASNHTTSRCTIPALCKLSRVPSSFLAADMHAGKESFLEKETERMAPSRGRQGRAGHRHYLCTASSSPVISLDETCPARPGQAHVACGFHSPPHSPDAMTFKATSLLSWRSWAIQTVDPPPKPSLYSTKYLPFNTFPMQMG